MNDDNVINYIFNALPPYVVEAIKQFEIEIGFDGIEEIRLRSNRYVCVTHANANYRLNTICTKEVLDGIFKRLCSDSVYAHKETIKNGYISIQNGIRIGVCGKATLEDDSILGITDISSLCIRLPHVHPDIGNELFSLFKKLTPGRGMLIYSPPGEGKTTILRALTQKLSGGGAPYRVVVVDSRGELGFALQQKDLCVDILLGYTKEKGIEIATRTMSAQVIVCDEIGSDYEAEAIINAYHCGVPLIASVHAVDYEELLCKPSIGYLIRSGAFGALVRIRRCEKAFEYKYDIKLCPNCYKENLC